MDKSDMKSDRKEAGRGPALLYLVMTAGAFLAMTFVFLAMPRSVYSELEKRSLAEFPAFTVDSLQSGEYAAAISHWFNDTEPFRDELMELSMSIRNGMRLVVGGDEAVIIHETDPEPASDTADEVEDEDIDLPVNDGVGKIANKGIVIVGTGENVRALMAYGGNGGGDNLVRVAKRYAEEMPSVRIYEMVAPLASEFYMPEKVKSVSRPQIATIDNIKSLAEGSAVTHVDAYHALKRHAMEDIYLRTDHHWAPLGAYYAAEQLAKAAGVPFKPLDGFYEKKVVHRFVGSMYGYSQDISVKNAPEDFVYYVPTGVDYTTTFRIYTLNDNYKVTGEGRPFKSSFFKSFKDGSGGAYSTFMGSDALLTVVETGTHNGRRLLIIKDSYGNAVPGYLFYSFEEIHVVDFRYFTHNIRRYCADNGITDLAIVFNVFNAYSSSSAARIERFLTQGEGEYAPAAKKGEEEPSKKSAGDSVKVQIPSRPEASAEPEVTSGAAVEPEAPSAAEPEQNPEDN